MRFGQPPLDLWKQVSQNVLHHRRVALTAIGVSGFVIAVRLMGILQAWELAAFDQFVQVRPAEPIDERIIIVGIHESDLQREGQWPIADATLAQLIRKIQGAKPRAIGLDLYRDLAVQPGHAELRQIYKTTPTLIGIQQIKDGVNAGVPAPPLLAERQQVGFNNVVLDPDGKVRRGLLYWKLDHGQTLPSFSLALALAYFKPYDITPKATANQPQTLQLGKTPFSQFKGNDGAYVRADQGGYQILANLRGPAHSFTTVSMSDVLENRIAPEQFNDRIVLIGSTAISLKDFFFTSYSNSLLNIFQPSDRPAQMAGVELQANLISQLLSGALDGQPQIKVWSELAESGWILLWAGIGASLCWRLRSPKSSALAITSAGMVLSFICYGAFVSGWWIPWVPPILALGGAAIGIIAHIAHQEEELKRSKEFLNTIINTIPDPIFVKDSQHRWVVVNQAYAKFLGYPLDYLLYKSDHDVFSLQEANAFWVQDQIVLTTAHEIESEESFIDRQGSLRWIETKRSLHIDAAGNRLLVGVIRDITERKRMEEELKHTAAELVKSNAELQKSAHHFSHLANHDALTGLPNRKLFYERLEQALEWARSHQQLVGVLFLDLDGFKLVNDTKGHDAGDLLLQAVAQRLQGCLRGSDTIARLGGDEFTVILPAIPSVQDAARVAEKILLTLTKPFFIQHYELSISCSIGISLFPQDGEESEILLRMADLAMYQAKQSGKNAYEFADCSPISLASSLSLQPLDSSLTQPRLL